MSVYMMVLIFVVIATVVFSVFYTFRVLKQQQAVKEGLDQPVPNAVQGHPYLKNPIFWSYLIGFGLLLAFIFYLAVR
ncbi:hypothetical protein [Bacillus xiapuensis]|uniref:hypothetical protein n=1 Tax=Bacillus xiapuensis TaxID=2014075 RepID=UPI000C25082A|nr:hypothetical protein [Bacillus xiapuensis]